MAQMTVHEVAQATPTTSSRALSKTIFGRDHQLEVGVAAAHMEGGFAAEDLVLEARRAAADAGLDPPKESAVRTNLARLVTARAVIEFPQPRPGSPAHYSAAKESAFWAFALELYSRS